MRTDQPERRQVRTDEPSERRQVRTDEHRPVSAAPALPGFADPTGDAQRVFRAVLDAMAHPTRTYPLAGPPEPPGGLGRGLAAVALMILDEDCTVWLGGALGDDAEAGTWLGFHTGARRVGEPGGAQFLFSAPASLPPLSSLALGTDEAPHHSATVVLDVRLPDDTGADHTSGRRELRFAARGPGIDGVATLEAPWAGDGFLNEWTYNTSQFPRGVDLLLVGEDTVTALPRTTHLDPRQEA